MSLNYTPATGFDIAVTGNYTGSMLVPYFGPAIPNPGQGELRESQAFFDAGVKLSYQINISDNMIMEINGGVRNVFNSYQNDLDVGPDRDPSYIYGPTSPRTVYFGVKIGNLL